MSKIMSRTTPKSATPTTKTPTQPFPFLSLPSEIRNRIYELALAPIKEDGSVSPHTIIASKKVHCPTATPALLHTSHQIYNEAAPILYRSTTFACYQFGSTGRWINKIGAANAGSIRTLRIFMSPGLNPNAIRGPILDDWDMMLDRCAERLSGLHYVYIYVESRSDDPRPAVLRALGKIQSLKTVEMAGAYPPKWPKYLRKFTKATILDTGRTSHKHKCSLTGSPRVDGSAYIAHVCDDEFLDFGAWCLGNDLSGGIF